MSSCWSGSPARCTPSRLMIRLYADSIRNRDAWVGSLDYRYFERMREKGSLAVRTRPLRERLWNRFILRWRCYVCERPTGGLFCRTHAWEEAP